MAFKIIPKVTKVSSSEIKLLLDDESELINVIQNYTVSAGNQSKVHLVHAIITKDNGANIKTIHLKDTSALDEDYVQDDIKSDPTYVFSGAAFDNLLTDGVFLTSQQLDDEEFFADGYYEVTILIYSEEDSVENLNYDSGVGVTYFLNQVLESVHKSTIQDQTLYPKEFYQVEKSMKANILIESLEIAGVYKKQLVFDKHLMYLQNLIG